MEDPDQGDHQDHDYSKYLTLINNCDPNDPLLSDTPLGKRLQQIPIAQVPLSKLTQLNQALNLEQLIRSRDGLARDYRGLAELMGFSSLEVETRFSRSYNPTKSLIDAYQSKMYLIEQNQLAGGPTSACSTANCKPFFSLNELLKMIERLERFDIIDDLLPSLIELASIDQLARRHDRQLIAEKNHHHHHHGQPIGNLQQSSVVISDLDRLTIDDNPMFKTYYDAFMCFAPEDWRHAEELRCLLEEHDKRIATANDLLPGHFEHDGLVRLIDSRCHKIIIVLTGNFLRSKECDFQLKFASEIAIRSGSPKIIPVLFEDCDDSSLPYMIRVVSKIDMTNKQAHGWQLRKLLCSLAIATRPNQDQQLAGGIDLHRQSTGANNSYHHRPSQYRNPLAHGVQPPPAMPALALSTHISNDQTNNHHSATSSNCNSPATPEIVFTEAPADEEPRSPLSTSSGGGGTVTPIVDLAHSQCLSTASHSSTYHDHPTTTTNTTTNQLYDGQPTAPIDRQQTPNLARGSSSATMCNSNPMSWFRQVKRKVLRSHASDVTTNSSRALLLTTNSAESIAIGSRGGQPNGYKNQQKDT